MTQTCQDPAFNDLHANFDLRFIARLVGASGDRRRLVVGQHLGIGGVQERFIATGACHAALEVVGNNQLWHPAEEGEGADM